MKLLVLTNGFPEIKKKKYNCHFVYEYAKLMQDHFDEIIIISPQPIFPKFLKRIPYLNRYARFSDFSNYNIGKIKVFYPNFVTLPLPFFRNRNHVFFEKKIFSTIKKERIDFDIIHAHFLYPTGAAALTVKNKFKKRLVLTLHGGDIYSWPFESKGHLTTAKRVLKNSDSITSPSNIIDKNVQRVLPSSVNKLIRIPNFIDSSKFHIKEKNLCRNMLRIPANKKVLLNVANITHGKGHHDLLKAFLRLKNNKEYICYIIGHGELDKSLQRQIVKNGLEDNIKLLGPMANNNLINWYNAADVFVFPSYFESFGIVQIEAMACGLPVVAYSNEGSKEIVNSPNFGSLVPIGNIDQLANTIEECFKKNWNKDLIRRNVLYNYSEEIVKKKLFDIYLEMTSFER